MPDDIWFEGLEVGQPREFRTRDGKYHTIEVLYLEEEADESGFRLVRFELDNEVMETQVKVAEGRELAAEIEMADPRNPYQIGAPFDADLWVVHKKAGDTVAEGEEILNLSLMKMETAVTSPVAGTVTRVPIHANYQLDRKMVPVRKGQLLMELAPTGARCRQCRAPLEEAFRFCPRCGTEL
jgi:pyruvate carboxylase